MDAEFIFLMAFIGTFAVIWWGIPKSLVGQRAFMGYCGVLGALAFPFIACALILLHWRYFEPDFHDRLFQQIVLLVTVLAGMPLGAVLGNESGQARRRELGKESSGSEDGAVPQNRATLGGEQSIAGAPVAPAPSVPAWHRVRWKQIGIFVMRDVLAPGLLELGLIFLVGSLLMATLR